MDSEGDGVQAPLDTHSGQVDYIRVMNRKRLSLRSPLNEKRKQEEQKEEELSRFSAYPHPAPLKVQSKQNDTSRRKQGRIPVTSSSQRVMR